MRNYGWRCMEGTLCTGLTGCVCNAPSITPPVHEYSHAIGHSIIGGVVYRGVGIPALGGKFVFGDFVDGQVWSIRVAGGVATELVDHTPDLGLAGGGVIETISVIGEDQSGELLVADVFGGNLYRVVPGAICAADYNFVNGLGVQDIFDYLQAWFAGNPRADFDGAGGIGVQDIFDFLGAWFVGCG